MRPASAPIPDSGVSRYVKAEDSTRRAFLSMVDDADIADFWNYHGWEESERIDWGAVCDSFNFEQAGPIMPTIPFEQQ